MSQTTRPIPTRRPRGLTAGSASVVAGALALLLALGLGGCGRERDTRTATSPRELPDQEVSDFVVSETDAGAVEWKLYARRASMFNAKALVLAQGVRVDFFDEQGARSSTLTADEGELHQVRRDMVARGNVVLQTTEGTRMSTEELKFDNASQKIRSERFVRFERAGNVLTGVGFESDPNLEHYEFKRQVRAVVRTQSGGGIESNGDAR